MLAKDASRQATVFLLFDIFISKKKLTPAHPLMLANPTSGGCDLNKLHPRILLHKFQLLTVPEILEKTNFQPILFISP